MMQIRSMAFDPGSRIPSRYTCEGRELSPPLSFSGVPDQAKSLVLIVDDPDAPDPLAPRTTWVHWVLYNLPPDTSGIAEGVRDQDLPPGTRVGQNDWKRYRYGGPCPPIGQHRYFHKLYALDTELSDIRLETKANVEAAMKGHVLAEAHLIGTYEKKALAH